MSRLLHRRTTAADVRVIFDLFDAARPRMTEGSLVQLALAFHDADPDDDRLAAVLREMARGELHRRRQDRTT